MIEVEVHQQLRAFLRQQGEPYWHHHLTMARLVARGLRLGRSALIQAGAPSGYHGRYRLSYLMPALLWQGPVILVVPEALQQRLLMVEIPRLRQWIETPKAIRTGDRFPSEDYDGLLLTSPESWLRDRLYSEGRFPAGIPTLIDGVDDLEDWVRQALTVSISPAQWDELMLAYPEQAEDIRNTRVRLTHAVFQHPANPYECYPVESWEQSLLRELADGLLAHAGDNPAPLPEPWASVLTRLHSDDVLFWAEVSRLHGQFSLFTCPLDVASYLQPIWEQQPLVLMGGTLDPETKALTYRQRLGLGDLTCVKFSLDRQHELIQLYLPDGLPLPNTPQFQPVLMQELRALLTTKTARQGLSVILVGDTPLRAQIAAVLAAEFGSRVQMEKTCLDEMGILVTGWEFWREHQGVLPTPRLLVIPTLPIPSLENPLVASRVAYYKKLRQDWFKLYLLPTALSELQRAIAPLRDSQGVVALLDNRVNYRTYGQQVLTALHPLARINYVDASLFSTPDYSSVD
ncbi:ATP-dependent DNA helicase [Leptolyngbya sp. FACHB-16]|nr:ATP-dependent DNA helicase [Leptolyngbya sp. FACHB-8]MBD2158761.1 ATP-dependent DNA helicase [Leptolyngbya sp. FACHB-16]